MKKFYSVFKKSSTFCMAFVLMATAFFRVENLQAQNSDKYHFGVRGGVGMSTFTGFKNSGLKVAICHDAEVFHLGGATLNQGSPRKLFLNYRNSLWMLLKNLPSGCLIFRIWARMVLDGMSAMVYLAQLKPKYFWAVVKAHFAFYANVPRLLKQRKSMKKPTEKLPTGMLDGSIVWQYFVKKRTTFGGISF